MVNFEISPIKLEDNSPITPIDNHPKLSISRADSSSFLADSAITVDTSEQKLFYGY